MTITVELPANIGQSLNAGWCDVPRKTLEAIAVQGYRDGVLTRSQVSEMLNQDVWETEAFLKEHGAFLHYDVHDLEADRRAIEEVLGRP